MSKQMPLTLGGAAAIVGVLLLWVRRWWSWNILAEHDRGDFSETFVVNATAL